MDPHSLIAQFEAGTLPKSLWTHQAHLTLALWHITQAPDLWSAICVIKDRIISFNRRVGTCNTGESGYHETITIFWATHLAEFRDRNAGLNFDNLLAALLRDERFTDTAYIKRYYDPAVLKSAKARAVYVEPVPQS